MSLIPTSGWLSISVKRSLCGGGEGDCVCSIRVLCALNPSYRRLSNEQRRKVVAQQSKQHSSMQDLKCKLFFFSSFFLLPPGLPSLVTLMSMSSDYVVFTLNPAPRLLRFGHLSAGGDEKSGAKGGRRGREFQPSMGRWGGRNK